MRARSATSRRIVHTILQKQLHYALCIMPAVLCLLSCPTVLFCAVQPVHFVCLRLKNPIREQVRHPFDSGLHFWFFARLRGWAAEEGEEDDEDEDDELGIFWVVFCGWREWM